MKIPVLKKAKEDQTELVMLDLNEVLFINIEKRNLVYHTLNGKFYHLSTLSELHDHFREAGFDLLDKTNLVNLNKIKMLDSKQSKVYFEEHPKSGSKYATVAFIKQKQFKQILARAIAKNTNATLEYSAKFQSDDGFRTVPHTSE